MRHRIADNSGMQFFRKKELPTFLWDRVYRQSRWNFSLPALRCFHSDNWLLKSGKAGLLLQLRSFLNRHLEDENPTILLLPHQEILSVGITREVREKPGPRANSTVRESLTYLEIQTKSEDFGKLEQLMQELKNDRSSEKNNPSGRFRHYPIQTVSPNIIRLTWKSHQDWIRPGIEKTLQALGRFITLHPAQNIDPKEEETLADLERRIVEFCQLGDEISAIKLVKKRYGLDTTRAKVLVQEMMGSL